MDKANMTTSISSHCGNFFLAFFRPPPIISMRIISRRILRDFYEKHTDAKTPLESWFQEAVAARWNGPQDIKPRYPSADILPGNRIVFNIKGNTYRLIVKIHYNTAIVFIRFIGTHSQYDNVDAETI